MCYYIHNKSTTTDVKRIFKIGLIAQRGVKSCEVSTKSAFVKILTLYYRSGTIPQRTYYLKGDYYETKYVDDREQTECFRS